MLNKCSLQSVVCACMLTSRRGGEQGAAGGLAVAVGQLRPVVEGEDLGGDGAAFIRVGRHG